MALCWEDWQATILLRGGQVQLTAGATPDFIFYYEARKSKNTKNNDLFPQTLMVGLRLHHITFELHRRLLAVPFQYYN